MRSYRFLAEGGPIPSDGLDNRIDYIFEDKNFDPSRLIVIENTAASSPAGYLGDMDIFAAYVTVDAYNDDEEKDRMFKWNLTAKTIMSVKNWKDFFKENKYSGNYFWFIP